MENESEPKKEKRSFKDILQLGAILLIGEAIQIWFRQDKYFGDPYDAKWLYFRDTMLFFAFLYIGTRPVKKKLSDNATK